MKLSIDGIHLADGSVIRDATAVIVDGFLVLEGPRHDWHSLSEIKWLEGVEEIQN